MIYECRLNRFKIRYLYAALLTITVLYLMSYMGLYSAEDWSAYAIGFALGTAAAYLIGNTKVRIEINRENVLVEHSGMVYGNFTVDSIDTIQLRGSDSMSKIVVVTNEGLKYFIPCECFSKKELDELLEKLKGG
jgi:hypothetical protein